MKITLCHGCFDILHIGHLRHLKAAAKLGDILVVSVTADAYVNKGPGRPVFPLAQRMEVLSSLDMVDKVWASHSSKPDQAITYWKPRYYVKGGEYAGRLPEEGLVVSLGGEVVFTNELTHSSTALVCSI